MGRVGQNRTCTPVYDRIYGGIPAKNTVYTLHIYVYGSGQLYIRDKFYFLSLWILSHERDLVPACSNV
jgi:hypothetical protein